MTANQIAYQSMLAKQKEADAKVGEATARSKLLEQQAQTERFKSGLEELNFLQEHETRGTPEERKYYSATETARNFWNFLPDMFKFSAGLKVGGK